MWSESECVPGVSTTLLGLHLSHNPLLQSELCALSLSPAPTNICPLRNGVQRPAYAAGAGMSGTQEPGARESVSLSGTMAGLLTRTQPLVSVQVWFDLLAFRETGLSEV